MRLLGLVRPPGLFGGLVVSCKALGIHFTHDLEHVLSVTRHFDCLENIPDVAVLVYDERCAFCVARGVSKDTQRRADGAVGIRQEGWLDSLGPRERDMRLDRVAGNPDECSVQCGEVSRPLTEVLRLDRSAGSGVLWICPQHDRFRPAEVG